MCVCMCVFVCVCVCVCVCARTVPKVVSEVSQRALLVCGASLDALATDILRATVSLPTFKELFASAAALDADCSFVRRNAVSGPWAALTVRGGTISKVSRKFGEVVSLGGVDTDHAHGGHDLPPLSPGKQLVHAVNAVALIAILLLARALNETIGGLSMTCGAFPKGWGVGPRLEKKENVVSTPSRPLPSGDAMPRSVGFKGPSKLYRLSRPKELGVGWEVAWG